MYRTNLISGDKMAQNFTFSNNDGYALWLSTEPARTDGNDKFMFIGSSAQYPVQAVHSSSTTGILGQTPDKAIYVDGVNGIVIKVNISAIRPHIEGCDDSQIPTSNQAFADKLLEIRSKVQMADRAYILRAYNIQGHQPHKQAGHEYRDLYVYIDSYDLSWDMDRPNEMNVSISFVMRNLEVGFDEQ